MPRRVDLRPRKEKLLSEVMFHANNLARGKRSEMMETEPYIEPDSVLIRFEEVIQFSSIQQYNTSVEEIIEIIKEDETVVGSWYYDKDNKGIIFTSSHFNSPSPSNSEEESEDEEIISLLSGNLSDS